MVHTVNVDSNFYASFVRSGAVVKTVANDLAWGDDKVPALEKVV